MAYERKTYDIFISDELREVLSEIESLSLVASLLLKKRHDKEELVDSPINFISISREDRTKLSYLTQERMSTVDVSEYWTSSRRFQVKPGSFITKLFKNIPGKEVEKFSNLFRSAVSKPKFNLSVVEGEKIRQYYHYESYSSDRGTLGASCMKHSSCQSMLDIYVDNPDAVKMLVMTNDCGGLLGRALLWQFESYKIMDRIYTTSDEELAFYFKKWATENGYLYKSEQNWYNTLFFEQIGQKRQEIQLSIKLKNFSYRKYPYIDTFKFFNPDTGVLTNFMPKGVYFQTLCASDGSRHASDYLIFDDIDRVLRYRGDAVRVHYLDIWTSSNNVEWSEINDQYILRKDCRYDEEINDFLFIGEYEKLNDKDRIEEIKLHIANRRNKSKDINDYNFGDLNSIMSTLGINEETLHSLMTRGSRRTIRPRSIEDVSQDPIVENPGVA